MGTIIIFIAVLAGILFFAEDAAVAAIAVIFVILLGLVILIFGMTSSDASENDPEKQRKIKANNDIASQQIEDSLINASEEYKKYRGLVNEKQPVQQHDTVEIQDDYICNIEDVVAVLDKLVPYGGDIGNNSTTVIKLINKIENTEPNKYSVSKRIDALHKHYYPTLVHAIESFIKVSISSKDYPLAEKQLNNSLVSFIDALNSIIEENNAGDIAEMSVSLNVLDSLMKKDGLKDQVKM